jgi:general secretion pathway protein D
MQNRAARIQDLLYSASGIARCRWTPALAVLIWICPAGCCLWGQSVRGQLGDVPPAASESTLLQAFEAATPQEIIAPGLVPPTPLPVPGSGEFLELVDFRDQTLGEAIRVFSEQSGLNLVASEDAHLKKVNLYLRNVRAMDVLENLTKTHDLYYKVDDTSGIIRLYTTEEYDRNLASFRDEQTEVFTLLYPNPVDVAVAIRDLFGDRVQLNFGIGDEDSILDLAFRLNRFDLIDSRSLGLGSFQGRYAFADRQFSNLSGLGGLGGLGGFYPGANRFPEPYLAANEYQRLQDLNAEQIQQLVEAIEAKEQSVPQPGDDEAIEQLLKERQATIYVTVVRRNNQVIIRTGDAETMNQVANLIHRLDVPTPLVLLEVKVMSVDLDDQFRSVFDYQYSDGGTVAGSFTTGDILPTPSDMLAGEDRRLASMIPGGSVLNQGDLTFQVVSNSFRARMQLLEDDNRVTILNTPLLLTANNEVSRIFIGDTIPFTIGFSAPQVIASGNNNTTIAGTPITELRDVGQSLLITPSINADRTVTLRIVQENARRVIDGGRIPVLNPETSQINDQSVDTVNRSTISGTIVAKDGLAVALGGLIEETVADQREQVPVIGKLPVLGFFFRRQETGRTRRELVVMVRPFIFNTPSESAAMSKELLKHLSVHPTALTGEPGLNTFSPDEVVRTDLDDCGLHREFRFHNVVPKRY